MAIDLAVSRAVTRIHALEKAVHEPGPWTMDLDGLIVPAQRTLGEYSVRFHAHFPASPGSCALILRAGEEQVWTSRPIPAVGHAFEVALELSLPAEVAA